LWGKLSDRAGIDDLTFHDLRGTAIVRLAIASATVPKIATFYATPTRRDAQSLSRWWPRD
jgi:hypothetical protein